MTNRSNGNGNGWRAIAGWASIGITVAALIGSTAYSLGSEHATTSSVVREAAVTSRENAQRVARDEVTHAVDREILPRLRDIQRQLDALKTQLDRIERQE